MRRWVGARPATLVTANDLLTRPGDRAVHARGTGVSVKDIPVPPELLADLHHPFLIITPDYIGPPRRVPSLHEGRSADTGSECPGSRRAVRPRRRGGRRSPTSVRPVLGAVALTAATVAPLTLAVAHWLAH